MLENVSGGFLLIRFSNYINHKCQLRRIKAAANIHRELPPISMGYSVDNFFKNIEKSSEEGKILPNWCVGSLFILPDFLTCCVSGSV